MNAVILKGSDMEDPLLQALGIIGALVGAIIIMFRYVFKTDKSSGCEEFKREIAEKLGVVEEKVLQLSEKDLPRLEAGISNACAEVGRHDTDLVRLESKVEGLTKRINGGNR